ncbi:MAG: low molecular weight phosphotyrosine protein phosphatase [Propionibacteriales bacterium]|nr:low molecular weight phosphotyrosine protein phosphatase [Propionibacteriales bacterium]
MPALRIALVCLGNICRSPTADVVLNQRLRDAGLDHAVTAESCGTGDWHVGEPMDPRTARVLTAAGYDASRHRARTFGPAWFDHDLILTMDASNHTDVLASLPVDRHDRVRLFRSWDPERDPDQPVPDVPDPWYGGPAGFADVLTIVERTCTALVADLEGAGQ